MEQRWVRTLRSLRLSDTQNGDNSLVALVEDDNLPTLCCHITQLAGQMGIVALVIIVETMDAENSWQLGSHK